MKIKQLEHYFHLHLIVLIFGFTGILGKLITFSAEYLVFYRLLFTLPFLFLFIKWREQSIRVSRRDLIQFLLVGIIVGFHWITFFHSIKVSNVSIALSCLACATLFVGILEPIFHNQKPHWIEIVLGIGVLVTLSLMLGFEISYVKGAIFGVLSAFLAATFNVINKKFSNTKSSLTLTFYELIGAFIPVLGIIFLTPKGNAAFPIPMNMDLVWLLLLASVCTAYPFAAIVNIMKSLSAFTVTLAINFEPIYAIILAFFIFGDSEKMSTPFYIGVAIVMLIVFLYPSIKRKYSKQLS
ncbi:MAG TPA: DMT family transporter [Bacteroidales bacterium]|nr:DMT family transporter [Bacteroidales bacterium]